jgi:hypothetical protein
MYSQPTSTVFLKPTKITLAFNPLKLSTNCMYYKLLHSITAFFLKSEKLRFHMILRTNSDYSLSSINQLIVVMETCWIFFEVRTEFVNTFISVFTGLN